MKSVARKIIDSEMIRFTIKLVIACAIVIVLFKTVFAVSFIPSESMENTLNIGDMVFGVRHYSEINRGDIIVFNRDGRLLIKRVIGLPGDAIVVSNGSVYVNGDELNEPYVKEEMNSKYDGTFTVDDDSYFVMGDNRNNSYDSRAWGTVKSDQIQSKSKCIIYPFSHFKKI